LAVIVILNTQLTLLLIITVGYFITRAGVFSQKTRADLTNIIIYVMMPCNTFSAFHKGITPEMLRQCMVVLFASFGLQTLVFILNKTLYFRIPKQRRVVLQYATITNNAAFMGLPILGAVFGPTGVLYGSIMLIPMRVVMWTFGLSLFTTMEKKETAKVLATHPCMLAVFVGLGYIFAPFELPVFLSGAIGMIGDCVSILPMLIVGSILCGVKPRDVLLKECFYFSVFRLVMILVTAFGVLTLLRLDPLVTGVVVLSSAMPAALTTAILAEKYGQDSEFATKAIFVSTVLSMVTLPIITELLAWLAPV